MPHPQMPTRALPNVVSSAGKEEPENCRGAHQRRSCPMGCKSSKLAELREAREELAQANAKVKELEAAQRARASEFVSKRKSRGGGQPNLASSRGSSTADSSSSSKTDSLSQAMAELDNGERSPRNKLLAANLADSTGGKMAPTEVVVVLNKPTVNTKLARWPGPLRSPVVSVLTILAVLSCAGLHH